MVIGARRSLKSPTHGHDEAVQAKRAANVVARQIRLRGSAAILTDRLFDDRGNRMSPTHANKRGITLVSSRHGV